MSRTLRPFGGFSSSSSRDIPLPSSTAWSTPSSEREHHLSSVVVVVVPPTVLSPRLLFVFISFLRSAFFYLLLVSLVQTCALILDSLLIVCPFFFLSFMLVTDDFFGRLGLCWIARFVRSFDVVSAPLSLSFTSILVRRLVVDGAGERLDR